MKNNRENNIIPDGISITGTLIPNSIIKNAIKAIVINLISFTSIINYTPI
jgi:hypothetical protein